MRWDSKPHPCQITAQRNGNPKLSSTHGLDTELRHLIGKSWEFLNTTHWEAAFKALAVLVQFREHFFDGRGQLAQLVQLWLHVALPPLFVDVRGVNSSELPRQILVQGDTLRPQVGDRIRYGLDVEQGRLARPQVVGVAKGLNGSFRTQLRSL